MKRYTKLTFKIFLQHVGKYRLSFVAVIIAIVIGVLGNLLPPLFYRNFFEVLTSDLTTAEKIPLLFHALYMVLGSYAIGWIGWRGGMFISSYLQVNVIGSIANACFEYLHKHSFTFFNNNFVGSLVKKVSRFYQAFQNLSDSILFEFTPFFIEILVILGILYTKNWRLGLVMSLWITIFMIANYLFTRYKLKFDIQKSEADSQVTGVLADTITNHVNVKLFNGFTREKNLFSETLDKMLSLRLFTWNLGSIFESFQAFVMIGLEISIFFVAIKLWEKGLISVGDFVLIQAYLITIFRHFWSFGWMVRRLYETVADAQEMTEIFDTPHELVDKPNATDLQVTKGAIEFKEVNFYYNSTRKILSNFNLFIYPGEKVALVGPSGAGKSTVVKLIMRQHDVSSGKILIDTQSISNLTQESLWAAISFVPQDPVLFHRPLKENIRYGKPDATDAEVIKAAKLAHCHEFIQSFADGYDTFVGERGVKLSGGERQRIAIARAILRNAPILILDEATSSLDSQSEHLIQDALAHLMKGKTVIVVAHRLSTIMKMDRILVIDHGQVIEEGTHAELINKPQGQYRHLWELQAGGFQHNKQEKTDEDLLLI